MKAFKLIIVVNENAKRILNENTVSFY